MGVEPERHLFAIFFLRIQAVFVFHPKNMHVLLLLFATVGASSAHTWDRFGRASPDALVPDNVTRIIALAVRPEYLLAEVFPGSRYGYAHRVEGDGFESLYSSGGGRLQSF